MKFKAIIVSAPCSVSDADLYLGAAGSVTICVVDAKRR